MITMQIEVPSETSSLVDKWNKLEENMFMEEKSKLGLKENTSMTNAKQMRYSEKHRHYQNAMDYHQRCINFAEKKNSLKITTRNEYKWKETCYGDYTKYKRGTRQQIVTARHYGGK